VPKALGYVLTDWPLHFTPEQVAAIRKAIADGVIMANIILDEVSAA
jgi:hypothetical protein